MAYLNKARLKKLKKIIEQISNNPDLLYNENLKFLTEFLTNCGCTIPTKYEGSYPECIVCHKYTTRTCSLCHQVLYCSDGCQQSNWYRHEDNCIVSESTTKEVSACNLCGKRSSLKCSQCKMVFYCSKLCQKTDWKEHKPDCKPYHPKIPEHSDTYEPMTQELKVLSLCSKYIMKYEVSEFHREYALLYPCEKDNIKMLESNYVMCHTNDPDCETFQIEHYFYEDPMTFYKRWSYFDMDKLQTFLDSHPSVGDIVERTPLPFNHRSDNMLNYYTIKNSPVRNIPHFLGKTYVSIGFVDFQQLLMSDILENESGDGGPLRFVGYEACFIPLAKSVILYEMIKANCHTDSVLQVWFSSAWSDRTKSEFTKTATNLINNKRDIHHEVKKLIKFWSETSMSIENAKLHWSKGTENREISLLANLKSKTDRIQYSRYVFTGYLFEEDEANFKHGNIVLLKLPSSRGNYIRADENIFATLTRDLQSELKTPIVSSFCDLLRKRLNNLASLIRQGKVECDFILGEITSTSTNLLKQIKELKPSMIDWSNIFDYVPKREAWKMIEACDSNNGTTIHCAHFMNWIYFVYGASFIDYSSRWKHLFPIWKANIQQQFEKQKVSLSFLREDHYFINPYNTADKVLAQECFKYYSKYFFAKKKMKVLHELSEGINIFERSNTTFHVVFSLKEK